MVELAATRLIALHKNKGKSVAACLKSRTDYAQNPDKTQQGELVSSYECSPLTVDEEFMLSKRQYELMTGRRQKNDVIAYQIRQSFKPGEITAEEANKVGYELAMRFTKGKYAFIVATHTDREHIHNHIIYNSTALDSTRKFRDFLLSGLAVQRLSDLICLEHQLSVIEIKPYRERQKRTLYPPRESNRDPRAFYENIEENIKRGSPDKAFLWPEDITEWTDGTFGYVMGLRPSSYHEITEFMLCNVRFKSFRTVVDAALRIVSAYRILHNAGYSYQDLNDGNFFVDPDTGKVLICDNDNVAPDGYVTGIAGKPGYMAPEIVVGDASPNSLTDRFSMAVILFILFTNTHPLKGKRYMKPALTPEDERILLGSDPLFIMDPDNDDNGPHPVAHANVRMIWPCLPDYVQQIFLQAFSQKALKKASARPKELDWLRVLTRFRSEIVACPACGNEIFTQDGRSCRCDVCRKPLNIPFRLELEDYSIPAVRNSRIYRCQLGICNESEALGPVAQVVEKADQPGVYGLRNRSGRRWDAITSKGVARKVGADEVVPIKDGIQIKIDEAKLAFKANS